MGLLATSSAFAGKIQTSDFSEILKRPLITGASLSADRSATSPGKRLALRYTEPQEIKTLAYGGRPGRDVLAMLPENVLKDRSIVIAVDLFFWDSTLGSPQASIKALGQFMDKVKKQNIPIVLGEVPTLLAGFQPQAAEMNRAIHQACAAYDKCYVMPFIELHQKILRDSFVLVEGKKFSLREMVPDGLHLSSKASDYLAGLMKDVLLQKVDIR